MSGELPNLPRSSGPFQGHPEGSEVFHPIVLVVSPSRWMKPARAVDATLQPLRDPTMAGLGAVAENTREQSAKLKRRRIEALDAMDAFSALLGRDCAVEVARVANRSMLRGVVVARAFEQWAITVWRKANGSYRVWRLVPGMEKALGVDASYSFPTRTMEGAKLSTVLGAPVKVAEQGELDANAQG